MPLSTSQIDEEVLEDISKKEAIIYYFTKENITFYGVLGVIFIVFGIMLIAYNETSEPLSLLNNSWMREPLIPMHQVFP